MISKRTRVIVLIVTALCFVAMLCVVIMVGGKNRGGQDTPYPYSYRQEKDGTLHVSIKEKVKAEHQWTIGDGSDGIVAVSTPATDGKNTTIVITAQSSGATTFTLEHQNLTNPSETDFILFLTVQVNIEQQVSVIQIRGQSQEPLKTEETEAGYRYEQNVSATGEPQLRFYAPDQQSANWELMEYDDTILEVVEEEAPDGYYSMTLRSIAPGETELSLTGRPQSTEGKQGITFTCKVTVAETGELTLSQETFAEAELLFESEDQVRQMEQVETELGTSMVLPEGAEAQSFQETQMIDEIQAGALTFTMADSEWTLYAITDTTAAHLSQAMLGAFKPPVDAPDALPPEGTLADAVAKQIAVDGTPILLTPTGEQTFAALWDTKDGNCWVLEGGDGTEAALQKMVQLLLKSMSEA